MIRASLALTVLAAATTAQIGPLPDRGTSVAPRQVLTGRVVEGGKAVAGATVHVVRRRYPLHNGTSRLAMQTVEQQVKTAEDGAFSVEVPAWRKLGVYAVHGDKTSQVVEDVTGPLTPLELELRPAGKLRAQLMHGQKPTRGKLGFRLVRISPSEHSVPIVVSGETSESGEVAADGLVPGPWLLQLAAGAYRLPTPVVLKEGEAQKVAVDEAIELQGLLTTGGTMGRPVGGARIELLDMRTWYETTTDANGRFVLRGVEEGPGAMILVDHPDHAKLAYTVQPGLSAEDSAPQITLTASEGQAVQGQIVDQQGKPMPGIEIVLRGEIHVSGMPTNDLTLVLKTDAEGRYSSRRVDKNGLFTIQVLAPDGEIQEIALIDPRRPSADAGTFALGSRRIEATVDVPKDSPHQFDVRLYGPKESGMWFNYVPLLPTDKGTWLTPSSLDGEYAIVAVSKTLGMGRAKAKLGPSSNDQAAIPVTLGLAEPRKIEGVVYGPDGKPADNAIVMVVPEGGGEDGGSPEWSDAPLNKLTEELFPEDKWPRKMTTQKDGKFAVWCCASTVSHDLISRPDRPMDPTFDAGRATVRVIRVLAIPNPVRIDLQQ